MRDINELLFGYLNGFAGRYEWFDSTIVFSAETLGIILLIGLIVFLLSHEHKQSGMHNVLAIFISVVVAYGVAWVIKHLYPSPRPFLVVPDAVSLVNHGGMDSFPSGHATFFGAIAVALYFYHKKLAAFFALGALIIGVARVIAGVHWPLDIVAGYAIAVATVPLVIVAYHSVFTVKK